MKRALIICATVPLLPGCAAVTGLAERFSPQQDAPLAAPADPFVPQPETVEVTTLAPETAAPPPPPAAVTAEALDTTTPEQRAAAAAPPAPGEGAGRALGSTIVSLGSPTEPGLWLKTPLVDAESQGRVTNPENGKSSLVTLIPLDGPKTGGSRMSLAAMRLIEVSLTDLTEVEVALEG